MITIPPLKQPPLTVLCKVMVLKGDDNKKLESWLHISLDTPR